MPRWLVLCTLVGILGCNPKDPRGGGLPARAASNPAVAVTSAMLAPQSDPIPGADDHPNDPAQATPVSLGETVVGVLGDANDRDAFALQLSSGVRVALQAHALGTVELELARPDGSRTRYSGNHLKLDLDLAGGYTLVVRSLVGPQDYALSVERNR